MSIKVLPRISPTSLNSFAECRLQWKWSHPDGYKRKGRSYHLDLGIGVHLALGERYEAVRLKKPRPDIVAIFSSWADMEIEKLNADDSMYPEDIETLAAVRTMGITMLEGYEEKYRNETFEVLATEKDVEKPIPGTDWTLRARIDTIVRDTTLGRLYVLEHKTFTTLHVDYLDKDHQLAAEAWLAQDLVDEPIDGVIYNGLRKKIPSNKTKSPFFERHYVSINEHQIGWLLRRCRAMHATLTAPRLSIYPEPSPIKCGMCIYKDPCSEFQRGGDFQFLLDTVYDKRDEEIVIEEEV